MQPLVCLFPSLLSICQDAEGLPVVVNTRNKSDGVYLCSYTPTTPFKHTLAITWGGVSIPNSPFRVSSQSQQPVTTVNKFPPKSKDLVGVDSAGVHNSEYLVKPERFKVVQSEPTVMAQRKCDDMGRKSKKPLVIITTYTEERYNF